MKLLVATNNKGKLEEYRELLAGLPIEFTSLEDEGISFEPAETGTTFEENAIIKAEAFARVSHLPTLADDSGLEIDALDGAPGIMSARYGGTGRHEDDQRLHLVLLQLNAVPWLQRTARFRCVVALAVPDEATRTTEGSVEGFIAEAPAGEHGFGYDPIFFLPDYHCTMAQLDPATKNRISHRARALDAARPLLSQVIAANE
jgi:XTP/dITP diphosphohydrolase